MESDERSLPIYEWKQVLCMSTAPRHSDDYEYEIAFGRLCAEGWSVRTHHNRPGLDVVVAVRPGCATPGCVGRA